MGVVVEPVYIHLPPGSEPPTIEHMPCRMVVVVEAEVSAEWQSKISDWIVESGCLFMMAWGKDCSSWDDSVDHANLAVFDYGDIPDDRFVMTTWHDDKPLAETFWFCKYAAHHPDVALPTACIVHISTDAHREKMVAAYLAADVE